MGKKITDAGILFFSVILATWILVWQEAAWKWPAFAFFVLAALAALIDFMLQFMPARGEERYKSTEEGDRAVHELILLDENEKPVKSWDLSGKVSMLVGRDNTEEPVDVDLEECEYSALVDYQHAVLNYCKGYWYVEDLASQNGVRIRKVDDGVCYKVMKSRPCRLMPGDLIYIAKTVLLIT